MAEPNGMQKDIEKSRQKPNLPSVLNSHSDRPSELRNVPSWVCERFDAHPDDIAILEVPDNSELYRMYISFLGKHAEDIRDNVGDDETCKADGGAVETSIKVGDESGSTSSADSDTESDDDSCDRDVERLTSLMMDKCVSRRPPRRPHLKISSGFWDKKPSNVLPKPKYVLGIGASTLRVNESATVYVTHTELSLPVGLTDEAHTPRTMRLYAQTVQTLRKLTKAMIEEEYQMPPPPPAKSDYSLLTLDVMGSCIKWRNRGLRPGRTLESVILRQGMLEAIVADFREFSANDTRDWYMKRGLPYRRTYLFHGPPGVGKTSTIRALAGLLRLPACFLSLGNVEVGNRQLVDAMQSIPKPSMLVIEDVDALFNSHREATTTPHLTFSGLLNALDGLVAADGVLCVFTTNHPDRLDPALARAGRIDRQFEFAPPGRLEISDLFRSYYPGSDEELVQKFTNQVYSHAGGAARSFATLQQHFIFTRKLDAKQSVEALPQFFKNYMAYTSKDGGALYT